jgi:alkylhydroperoxidase family enzyme
MAATNASIRIREVSARGETEECHYLLNAWRESPLFGGRERDAPTGIDVMTSVSETHVPDAVYDPPRQHFSEMELANPTLCVAAINAWNRIAISLRAVPSRHWKGRN